MKKGFRTIIIDSKTYNWRFLESIEIRPNKNQSNKLEIDIGYFDCWLFVNEGADKPKDFEPKMVTPSFIKKAIESAVQLGWNMEKPHQLTKIKYENFKFEIVE